MQGTLSRTAVVLVAAALVSPAAASQQGQSQTREPAPVIVEIRDDGFDWGAAGIGAAGGLGLALIASTAIGRFAAPRRPLGNTQQSRRQRSALKTAAGNWARAGATDPEEEGETHADARSC